MAPTQQTTGRSHTASAKVLVEQDGPVLRIALNRPEKANAVDADMITDLSHARAIR
ncbi:hypothetical protein [Streptomyces sp. NPDC059378]|uniref:hypothetical protein n=1 Tax=Streptomyces sp. NPDC059378 TaxID=3346815 RepID=UPI0036A756F7